MNKLVVKKVNINDLKEHPDNPRVTLQSTDEMYKQLKESILKFGYLNPIIVNKRSGYVISGHQRLQVLRDMNIKEIDVIEVDIPVDKEKGLMVALNAIRGDWDIAKLQKLVAKLSTKNVNFKGTGFTKQDIRVLIDQFSERKQLKRILKENNDIPLKWECKIGSCNFKIDNDLYIELVKIYKKQGNLDKLLEVVLNKL